MVDERVSEDQFSRVKQISSFAITIANAAGKSANLELLPKAVKLGGNGPIMTQSLIKLGMGLSYAGALGAEEIHPIFKSFAESCEQVVSVCEPAKTMALEFNDGKIMLCQLNDLYQVNRNSLELFIKKQLVEADYFCFLNWTELPNLNGVYRVIVEQLEELKPKLKRPTFIDLADFKRRSDKDLSEAIELVKRMSVYLDIHLGLNWSEAQQMAQHLLAEQDFSDYSLSQLAELLQKQLRLKAICVHSHHEVTASDEKTYSVDTLYIKEPKISTGAGDHFNAGYFRAVLGGLDLEKCLQLGVLNSAYYVKTADTPGLKDLEGFSQKPNYPALLGECDGLRVN